MEKFSIYNPTRLHFGEGVVDKLGRKTRQYGEKALLISGKGSVKKYGYFDKVVDQLGSAGVEVIEYSGIKPNPVIEDVREAVLLGKQENIDVIVALGGGSAVDSAKVVSVSINSDADAWDIMKGRTAPDQAVPLICVLTLAATGTEMNGAAVVQNHETGEKSGFVSELMFPKESFLDPAFTVSVPRDYTAYGIVDLIAHCLETYFGAGEPEVIDQFTFDIIKDAMDNGPKLLKDLTDVELRARILLDSTLALNGITRYAKKNGDWAVHGIGHELSLLFDLAHGATLSIAYPAWLRLHQDRCPQRILKMGQHLFNASTVEESIAGLENFFISIQSPVRLADAGIGTEHSDAILNQLKTNKVSGVNYHLVDDDYTTLINFMM